MSAALGTIHSLYIDDIKSTFKVLASGELAEYTLYEDAANTHTIPQLAMARRSWMISMLQNAYFKEARVRVTFSAEKAVTSLELYPPLAQVQLPPLGDPPFHKSIK